MSSVSKHWVFQTNKEYFGLDIELNFTSTWGDLHYLGLTGLEVLGKDAEVLSVAADMLDAHPRDLNTLPGVEGDERTLDK